MFRAFIAFCVEQKIGNLHFLLETGLTNDENFDVQWFAQEIQLPLRQILMNSKVVESRDGSMIELKESTIIKLEEKNLIKNANFF